MKFKLRHRLVTNVRYHHLHSPVFPDFSVFAEVNNTNRSNLNMVRFSSPSPKSSSPFTKHRRSNRRIQSQNTRKRIYDNSSKDEGSSWSSQSLHHHEEGNDNDNNDGDRRSSFNFAAKPSMTVIRDPKPVSLNGAQQGSCINIAPLPTFKGFPNECPITHLSRFHKVCRANNAGTIEDMARIFPVTLEGEAGMWYDLNIEPYNSLSWDEVKEAFLQAYGGHSLDDQILKAELANLTQEQNQSIRSYFLKLQWILRHCPDHGIPDGLIKDVFVDGLRGDFKNWVVAQKPESLHEALRMALDWERKKSIGVAKGEIKCGFCEGFWHEEGECEVRQRMRELWLNSRRGGEGAEEEREGEEGAGLRDKKGQCQCPKHQCWKKLQRNSSRVSAWSSPAD